MWVGTIGRKRPELTNTPSRHMNGSACASLRRMEPISELPPDDLPIAPPMAGPASTASDRRGVPRPYRSRSTSPTERFQSRARELGPGLITGAADDDS